MEEENLAEQVVDEVVTLEEGAIDTAAPEVTAAPDTVETDEKPKEAEVDERQKALNKLAFEKREQKRRADDLERQLAAIKKQQDVSVEVPKLPTEEDYDYDADKYQAAMSDYQSKLVASQVQKSLSSYQEQEILRKQQVEQAEAQERFNQQVAESNIAGYADAIQTLPIFDPSVTTAIMQADNGVKIAYYLTQHLDQADIIASSNPVVAAMKIGEISARLASATTKNQSSKTPDPIEPINQGGAGISEAVDPLLDGCTFE